MKNFKTFWYEEDGVGVVEIILILVILIALIVIFREKITAIVKSAFSSITSDSSTITSKIKI
ncbi:MAG: holin, BlyA family protein [Lachnospiraceae bacterium]|nr:holin, BlyA family protein [Lachnospiraceae bacterium]